MEVLENRCVGFHHAEPQTHLKHGRVDNHGLKPTCVLMEVKSNDTHEKNQEVLRKLVVARRHTSLFFLVFVRVLNPLVEVHVNSLADQHAQNKLSSSRFRIKNEEEA